MQLKSSGNQHHHHQASGNRKFATCSGPKTPSSAQRQMAAPWLDPVLHQPPHQDAKAGKGDAGLFLCWFFTCPPHADWELSLAELLQVSTGQRWHFCQEHTRVRTAQDRLRQREGISAEVLLLCRSFSWGELHRFSRLALGLGLFSWLEAGWGCSVCSGQRHHQALQLRQSFNLLPSASHLTPIFATCPISCPG